MILQFAQWSNIPWCQKKFTFTYAFAVRLFIKFTSAKICVPTEKIPSIFHLSNLRFIGMNHSRLLQKSYCVRKRECTAKIHSQDFGIRATIIKISYMDLFAENGGVIVTNSLISLTRLSFQRQGSARYNTLIAIRLLLIKISFFSQIMRYCFHEVKYLCPKQY